MTTIDRALFKFFKTQLTYSQCGEDRIAKFLLGDRQIKYLDIGTNHPKMGNNTYLFYREGSSGICVEPNPAFCDLVRKTRPRDTVINAGIGVEDGEAEFFVIDPHTLSTFSREDAEKANVEYSLTIPIRNINSFADEYDLISIDVEGWNEPIVDSIDFSQLTAKTFIVETLEYSAEGHARKFTGIIDRFLANGYKIYADTYINTIFVN